MRAGNLMPLSEARIKVARWDHDEWRKLPIDCQWLYDTIRSQTSINHAGVGQIPRRMWANLAADEDAGDRIAAAMKVLTDRRFVITDDDTDEVLIRSYIRHDIMDGPPGMFVAAMVCAQGTRSPRLRAALRAELLRLDPAAIEVRKQGRASAHPYAAWRAAVDGLAPQPCPPGAADDPEDPSYGMGHGISNGMGHGISHAMPEPGSGHGMGHGISNGISHGMGHGIGAGAGAGVGCNPPVQWESFSKSAPRAPAYAPPREEPDHGAGHHADHGVIIDYGRGSPAEPPPESTSDEVTTRRMIRKRAAAARTPAALDALATSGPSLALVARVTAGWDLPPVGRVKRQWAASVHELLREGIPESAVEVGMRACAGKGFGPNALGGFVFGEANRSAVPGTGMVPATPPPGTSSQRANAILAHLGKGGIA